MLDFVIHFLFVLLGWAESHPYHAMIIVFVLFFVFMNKTIIDNSTKEHWR